MVTVIDAIAQAIADAQDIEDVQGVDRLSELAQDVMNGVIGEREARRRINCIEAGLSFCFTLIDYGQGEFDIVPHIPETVYDDEIDPCDLWLEMQPE